VRWTLLATPLFSTSEVLIGALQGVQKFHYRPLLRDLGASAFFAPIALGLSFVPLLGPKALGIGFAAGHGAIALLSAWFWARESRDSSRGPLLPKPELFRYALPLWLADSVNSAGLRAAVLLMARFAAPGTVAAFGIVQNIWQTANLARRAFETPLASLTASSATTEDVEFLFRKVVRRVLLWQMPLVMLAAAAGGSLLHLISPQLGTSQEHFGLALLIASTYVITGPSLGQQVLAGLGHSPRLFFGSLLSTVLNIALLFLLTPRYGLVGACVSQAGVAIGGATLGAFQLRRFARLSPFPRPYWRTLGICLLPSVAGVAMYYAQPDLPWMAWSLGIVSTAIWAILVPARLKE